jgi:hypothetical protein
MGARSDAVKDLESIVASTNRFRIGLAQADANNLGTKLGEDDFPEILRLLHEAAALGACNFGLKYEEGPGLLLPHITAFRTAARLLCIESWVRAAHGDAPGALASLRDAFRIAAYPEQDNVLVSWLVTVACEGLALEGLATVLDRLPPDAIPADELSGLAAHFKVRREALRPSLVRTLDSERVAFGSWVFNRILDGTATSSEILAIGLDGAAQKVMLAGYGTFGRAFLKADYRAYLDSMMHMRATAGNPWAPGTAPPEPPRTAIFTQLLVPALESVLARAAEHEAALDTARVGLLLELRLKEAGAYPPSLADLPEADAVPRDLFTGAPLVYKPSGAACLVYSVGKDRTDNGGARKEVTPEGYDIAWSVDRSRPSATP